MKIEPKKEVYWYSKKKPEINKYQPAEAAGQAADVVIVGGGMAGLTTAQVLNEAGRKVVLMECRFCGGGASGKSSGFITPDSENQLTDLVEDYGEEGAKKMRTFTNNGIELIRKNIQKYSIDCDYRIQDSFWVANSKKAFKKVAEEHQTRLSLGYDSRLYQKEELSQILPSQNYFGAVRYGKTFGMNSYLYCQGMREALTKNGVEIYDEAKVISIQPGLVKGENFSIKAKQIIVATDRFLADLKIHEPEIYHAQTFLVVSSPLSRDQIKKIFPSDELMVWDTDLIYQYFRLVENNRLLFGAANLFYTYKKEENNDWSKVIAKIRRYLKTKFSIEDINFEYTWAGLIGVTKDLMPIAGEVEGEKGIFYISGASGLPWAAALGIYIAEKILHGRNEFDQDFRADRHYPVSNALQKILTKIPAFAISHGIVEYF